MKEAVKCDYSFVLLKTMVLTKTNKLILSLIELAFARHEISSNPSADRFKDLIFLLREAFQTRKWGNLDRVKKFPIPFSAGVISTWYPVQSFPAF